MVSRAFFIVVAALLCHSGYAQNDSTARKTSHFIGVQANQLLRQILNFSNANAATNNPYLLTYSLNSRKSGHGFSLGVGYFMSEVTDGDFFNKRETSIKNFSLRLGWEKKSFFGKNQKWVATYGLDFIRNANRNETTNSTENDFGGSHITTKSSAKGNGFGPRLSLNYRFTDRLMIGTEVNYYFLKTKTELEVSSSITSLQWDPNTGQQISVTTKDADKRDDESKRFELGPPVAIFLILNL